MTDYTFFLRSQLQDSNLIVAVDLSAKIEWPGGISRQLYSAYEAIGCQYDADRTQIANIHVAPFECDPAKQVDEATARTIHPELFAYLDKASVMTEPVIAEAEQIVQAVQKRRREPRKRKDFRLPVDLLHALKAVADEEGTSDTEIIVNLLRGDSRIQQKLAKEGDR